MSPSRNAQEGPDNKTLQELRDEVKDLNKTTKKTIKSTDRVSWAVLVIAMVQVAIAIFQYLQDVMSTHHNSWIGVFWVLLLLAVVFIIFKTGFDEKD